MRKLMPSFASVATRNVIAATLITSAVSITSPAAFAADTCLARPNLRAEQGGHWYYRVDRANHRRCWYQQSPASEMGGARPVPAPTAQNPNPVASANPVSSLLTSIAALVTAPAAATAAPAGASHEPRFLETTSERGLKRQSASAKSAEPDKSFASRYPDFSRAEPTPVVERFSPPPPPSSPAWSQAQARAPLDAVTRETLFQEFLRWQERRNNVVW
jgi:hypothetical protein